MNSKFTMFVESVAHESREVSRKRTRYVRNVPATNSMIEKKTLIFDG
jgi:hypothetical protein